MAGKIQRVSQLADQTAHDVTRDVGGWKQYLDTASRLYKYKFEDQLLIYAQRPDATACAAMELWNEKMHRWVKAGSKGIALIRENENGRARLQYVFDVSDTRPVRGAKMPYLWEMRDEHHPAVLAALERMYGESDRQELGSRLMEAAARAVEDVYPEYLRDLAYDTEGSFLEGLDDLNREVCFRDTLTASVQYTLLTRCGLDASDYLDDDDLRGITEFSTPAVLHHLGDAASALSMGILQEIGRTIRNYDREHYASRQKNLQKALESPADIGYTKAAREFNTLKRESKERSIENGRADIQEEWGLSDTGSDNGRGGRNGGSDVREVRASAADVPEGTPPRDIHLDAADGEAHAAPETDGRAGAGTGRPDGGRDDGAERGGREPERAGSDGVGAGSGQLHGTGGGSRAEGDRLPVSQEEPEPEKESGVRPEIQGEAAESEVQTGTEPEIWDEQQNKEAQETAGEDPAVSASKEEETPEPEFFQFSLFPTVEEQVSHIAEAQAEEKQAKKTAPQVAEGDLLPQVPDVVAGRALTSGSDERNSILRIVAFYQKPHDEKEAAAFLADEYGTGGKGLSIGGREYAMWFDKEGIRIAPGRRADLPGNTFVSWEKAAGLVSGLLDNGQYAGREQLEAARGNEYRELAEKLWYLRQDLSDEARELGFLPYLSEIYRDMPGFPDGTKKLAQCLEEPETRQKLSDELDGFAEAFRADRSLSRFPRLHNPEALSRRIAALYLPVKTFPSIEGFEPSRVSFITENEIDHMFTRGSGVSEGKMRIYSYFVQGHDAKERAAFLRDEYGTGGYSTTGQNEWHDSKGIKFVRSDAVSGYDGYDRVSLNWDKVQKRIGKLIEDGRYLNPEELAYTTQYEKIQLARSVRSFYFCDPNRQEHLSPYDRTFDEAEKQILTVLDDPERCTAMYEDMVKAFAVATPDVRGYGTMQKALEDMGAFQRGEYSLFTPLSAEILQAQRQKKQEAKETDKKEKEPVGELEAAARALAKKQKKKVREAADGQLSFDFAPIAGEETEPEPEGQETPEQEAIEESVKKGASVMLQERGLAVSDELLEAVAEELGQESADAAALADQVEETLRRDEEETILSRYSLGFGTMGNGVTVWNRLEEEHGDYKTIAHIDPDRSVTFYDDGLPDMIKEQIQNFAATETMTISATQDAPVFSVPPITEREQAEEKEAEAEIQAGEIQTAETQTRETQTGKTQETEIQTAETPKTELPRKTPTALYRETLSLLVDVTRQSSFYEYLRDRKTDYDSAEAELDSELTYFIDEIADSQPDLYEAFQSLPQFRAWMVEDILLRTYDDVLLDNRDALLRYAGEPDSPEWAREETPGQEATHEELQPGQADGEKEQAAPVSSDITESAGTETVEPDLAPNVEEYLNLKTQYPDKLVGVQVGSYHLFYGEDARAAAPALGTKLLKKEIEGLGETFVTGGGTWQTALKKLLEHGHSVVFAGQNPEHGADAPYEVIKEQDIADYLPLGMELTIDGRRMKIDSVDYGNGKVSLQDMELRGWFPVFRQETVPFVRGYVEEEQEKEESREAALTEAVEPEAAGMEPEPAASGEERQTETPDSDEMKEAKGLIEDFCYDEYQAESVDFSNLEEIGLAYGTTDGGFEVQVNANLVDFSISQFVDGKCVEKRQYDSLRELIDAELAWLDYDQLTYVEPHIQEELEADLREQITLEGMQGAQEVDFSFSLGAGSEQTKAPERESTDGQEESTAQGTDTRQEETAEPGTGTRQEETVQPGNGGRQKETSEPGTAAGQEEAPESEAGGRQEETPEFVEIEGGMVESGEPLAFTGRRLPYDIILQPLKMGPDRVNFHITDDDLGVGGQKAKYQNNVAAIRTLKQIEAENRLATPEEQDVLSNYVGWGGIAQAFDPANEKWGKEYAELKELLTPEEYESARSTVLNAHYTSPTVIKAMYEAVSRMDFTPGNILEPSCGIGNFFGLVPEAYKNTNLYGVELDSLTGRIAGQLYQKASIAISGFEESDHPDDFFDLAVGNVPFGEYKVSDRRYDRENLLIHDYFLTKSMDKIRPGGVAAFITSKGTMDKANSKAREALAQKADLLGAIRLPNNAFQANAGTSVTTDILFFQKRGSAPEKLPEWVHTGQTENGVPLNNYFLSHPEMVLGNMEFYQNMYGNATETACLPIEGADLKEQLAEAINHIAPPDRELLHMDAPETDKGKEAETIPADPDVRNFSFTEKGGKLYFRENSRMKLEEPGKTQAARIRGMIGIRDSARRLIDLQMTGAGDAEIEAEQAYLNSLYDTFQKKYGLLNSTGNRLSFRQDSSYPLLCSLEVLDEEGNFKRKADMFSKRTIQHRKPVTSVDTAVEALGVSIGEKACVDLGFMASLMGGSEKIPQIVSDLKGIIFKDPASGPFDLESGGDNWHKGWQAADEYISGNVRLKLAEARAAAEKYPEFAVNVSELEKVQPKDLTAPEISVRIGAPWIDTKYYKEFMFELCQTPYHLQDRKINIAYSDVTGEWRVKGKSEDRTTNTRVWNTYGTKRINAYAIMEASLNQRSVQIFDTHYDEDGKETRVLNEKETAIAQQKQEAIKDAFQNWIFKDPDRRADLCATYNRLFNAMRPREYDGRHINFIGMNPEIRLEPHQRNAVARVLYGGNSLLAHVVGAGKTFEMVAAAMESKRLGLCRKSMIVVPNHLTEQWGGDFLALYPGAKVLVATKKDFEPKNRKKFCARIATGDFDAVIMGHSQFEKLPISPERQRAIIEEQIDEIVGAIAEAKANKEEKFTIKQMERTRKGLEADLKKLHGKKKDDTVFFEELGIDRLFVDEAHSFKNLYMHTKMRNVAGISQTKAQKSSDMFAKCRYLDEITGGRGVVFATGTPVSNSMVELYTMMRYLQYNMLEQGYRDSTGKTHSLKHFDNWAATFGEQVSAVELKPEGTGFRLKTRFARFYNLPELMNLWKDAADIQTADMLKLPVPEAEYITIQTEPSEAQKKMVEGLAERAEKIRNGSVDPSVDNMLKVTSDGRKLALDQRIMNPLLGDDPGSKVNACVDNVFQIWQESTPTKGTQLIFSDLSTPKGRREPKKETEKETEETDGKEAETPEESAMESSVYEDIRKKLIAKGVPAEEIAFIHDANTDTQKAELFAKVRSGQVRVLLGSTQKMGAGTNVQTKLVASHDLDCPWRPADLEQRAGRIVRRGNENDHVKIFRYVTKGTFDAYTWGLVESKQKFIGQIMTSKSPARSIDDVDATALSYAEVKMLATGDPRIKEKMDLDIQVTKLKMLKSNHTAQQYEMQDKVRGYFPNKIKETELLIDCLKADLPLLEAHPVKEDAFTMEVMGTTYTDRKEAGQAIVAACRLMDDPDKDMELGQYRGFPMKLCFDGSKFKVTMKQHLTHTAELSNDIVGNITRINNALEKIPQSLNNHEENLKRLRSELENAREEADRPFPQEEELAEKSARLAELNVILDSKEKGRDPERETAEEEPAAVGVDRHDTPMGKPSILKLLKEYERPTPVPSGMERNQEER